NSRRAAGRPDLHRRHREAKSLRELYRPVEAGLRGENAEIFAPGAGSNVDLADGVADRHRHLAKDGVALQMAVLVVEVLEVIEVQQEAGERTPVTLGPPAPPLHPT